MMCTKTERYFVYLYKSVLSLKKISLLSCLYNREAKIP